MDDDCMMGCCGTAPRRSVSELFDRGLRRSRLPALPIGGGTHHANGFDASFSLAVADGAVERIGFKASTCITLVAYCELIAELAAGMDFARAMRITAADLVTELPAVPLLKRDRAPLAIAAFRDALATAVQISTSTIQGELIHESRLHLRHVAP